MTASAAVAAGCQVTAVAATERELDAGPATLYAKEGVYSTFRDQCLFIARKDGKLCAYSSMCTHRRCKLTAEQDSSFYCPCHGSTFDTGGKVTKGPAKRDLPSYNAVINDKGHLIVTVPMA